MTAAPRCGARSLDETAEALGADARAYRALIGPFARDWERCAQFVLGPLEAAATPALARASALRARGRRPCAPGPHARGPRRCWPGWPRTRCGR